MAQIGQQLLQPESGWRRYDDTDSNISYIGDWIHTNYASYYKTTASYIQTNGELKFNFTGDKIRIIGQSNLTSNAYSENVKIIIDNVIYILNGKIGSGTQILQFEKQNLRYKEHHIKIINAENKEYDFDAIDIDKNGELKPYNPNLYKYLIKQNNNYYTIKSEFHKNGNYESITELEGKEILNQTDFETFGIDDLNLLTETINTQVVNGIDEGNLGNGKLFEIYFSNDFMSISEVK
ncbi:cell adhesion protein [Clostridium botulinum]|nr:cell adhesion protein [Clostridium botulinum]